MLFQTPKSFLFTAGLALLLSGCSMATSSSQADLQSAETSFETNTVASSCAESVSVSAVSSSRPGLDEAESAAYSAESPSQEIVMSSEFQTSDLVLYTQTLSCFFHSPLQSTKDIPLDYYLSYFLLYQTFERNEASGRYTLNDHYFWEIPEQDLLQTADLYLGLSNLSISDLSVWPFGAPQNGICYFTQETSLPYSDTAITNITVDKETGETLVFADLYDSQYEDSTQQKTSLLYHFICVSTANGHNLYQLDSIIAQ